MSSDARHTETPRIVTLAEKIRNAGVGGFISPTFLNEFDALARGKTFGTRKYSGEAAKLEDAFRKKDNITYASTYTDLHIMCDTVCREHLAATDNWRPQ